MDKKALYTAIFPQDTNAVLNSGITFIVLFSQEKPLRWKEINIYIHTPTKRHTYTWVKWNRFLLSLLPSFVHKLSSTIYYCNSTISNSSYFLVGRIYSSITQLLENQICVKKHKYSLIQQYQSWQVHQFLSFLILVKAGGLSTWNKLLLYCFKLFTTIRRSSSKHAFLKTSQNPQENTCVRVSF